MADLDPYAIDNRLLVDPDAGTTTETAIIIYSDSFGTHAGLIRREPIKFRQPGDNRIQLRHRWTFQRDIVSLADRNAPERCRERLEQKRNVALVPVEMDPGFSWKDAIDKAKDLQDNGEDDT